MVDVTRPITQSAVEIALAPMASVRAVDVVPGFPTAPDKLTLPVKFIAGDWTLTNPAIGGTLRVDVITLADAGGADILDIEYSVDNGTWASSGNTGTGFFDITGLTNTVSYDIEIRIVTRVGAAVDSDIKSATPTV